MRILHSASSDHLRGDFGCGGMSAQTPAQNLVHRPAPLFIRDGSVRGRKSGSGGLSRQSRTAEFLGDVVRAVPGGVAADSSSGRRSMAQGGAVLAISMDDDPAPVRKTARRLHLDFPVVMGDARLGEEYGGVLGLPMTYLINREGRIVRRDQGRDRFEHDRSRGFKHFSTPTDPDGQISDARLLSSSIGGFRKNQS